jgi:hypothetical protein
VGVCDAAESCTGLAGAACPADAREPCAVVTDSQLCPFDVNPNKGECVDSSGVPIPGAYCDPLDGNPGCATGTCEQSGQFRLVFTPSPKDGWPAYKLNASNPGQTFYNLIVEGDPGPATVQVNIPYPYVTMGAMPVHVYDAMEVAFDEDGCFVPQEALQAFDQQIAIGDYIGGVTPGGGSTLSCGQVGCGLDGEGSCSFEVDVVIPESGQAYVNVHLDYGLEGVAVDANDGTLVNAGATACNGLPDRYDQGTPNAVFGGWDALLNNATNDGPLALSNCKSYGFSHECLADCTGDDADTVQSLNEFKKIAGAFGQVQSSASGSGIAGTTVRLRRLSTGQIVQLGVTDEDGSYILVYKHTGSPENYRVEFVDFGLDKQVQFKGNGWAEVSLDAFTGSITGEWTDGGATKKGRR